MKANELMIGDWVEVPFLEGKPKIVKVEEILSDEINPEWDGMENYGGIKIKYVNPIPLTPEILENNGFVYESKDQLFKDIYPRISMLYAQYRLVENGYINYGEMPEIKYVHQLQHALRLCGIEKTIEL